MIPKERWRSFGFLDQCATYSLYNDLTMTMDTRLPEWLAKEY